MAEEEQKQKLMDLFYAEEWTATSKHVYITANWQNKKLHICFDGYQETEVLSYPFEQLKKLLNHLAELDVLAQQIINETAPDGDPEDLDLSDIFIYKDNTFALGYDTGASPAGELYLYVKFDWNLQPDKEIIYEVYSFKNKKTNIEEANKLC